MKYTDLHALSDEQLVHKELGLERDLIEATFRHKTGQLEDSSKLGRIRKDIARVRTAERLREVAQGVARNSLRDRYRSSFRPGAMAAPAAQAKESAGFLKGVVDKLGGGE